MYTVHQAKTNLSKLIAEAEEGKEVVIARGKTPVARLVPIKPKSKRRGYGIWKNKLRAAPDAFDPLTEEELKDWGIE
jgi:prevent-host-death family protein